MSRPSITETIQAHYAAVARSNISQDTPGVKAVAEAFGYSADELSQLPAAANLGLGCGNPTAMAGLQPGEVVVDLGCGAGIDVLLAARRVGPSGKAIGIDRTPEMIERARLNAVQTGQTNVEFYQADLAALPLADATVDCLISNCVINLVEDKAAVFREMYRVLKPGGRVAISDIALKQPLPAELANHIAAIVGCIAGALSMEQYASQLLNAGFCDVVITDSGADLHAYALIEGQLACCSPAMAERSAAESVEKTASHPNHSIEVAPVINLCLTENNNRGDAPGCCDTTSAEVPTVPTSSRDITSPVHRALAQLLQCYNLNDFAASVKVTARKPRCN
ncbi:MAG: arsenite methyltransferase [Gemmataceae bacterium]|nr:arsenite methyltransferase [Gemmataceae bacterium]